MIESKIGLNLTGVENTGVKNENFLNPIVEAVNKVASVIDSNDEILKLVTNFFKNSIESNSSVSFFETQIPLFQIKNSLFKEAFMSFLEELGIKKFYVKLILKGIENCLKEGVSSFLQEVPHEIESEIKRKISVSFVNEGIDGKIKIKIEGKSALEGQAGYIKELLDLKKIAGLTKPNGGVDFSFRNGFPSVKKGDALFQIHLPVQGVLGIDWKGELIEPNPVKTINVITTGVFVDGKDGVFKFFAKKDGVVSIGRDKGDIIEHLSVQKFLNLTDVDFRGGSLNVLAGISCKNILDGFSVIAEYVKVCSVDGGYVESTVGSVSIDEIFSGSVVYSVDSIVTKMVRGATSLTAEKRIIINGDVSDVPKIKAPIVDLVVGSLNNSTINCEKVFMKNVRLVGENKIVLAEDLFLEKNELLSQKASLAEQINAQDLKVKGCNKTIASFLNELFLFLESSQVYELKDLIKQKKLNLTESEWDRFNSFGTNLIIKNIKKSLKDRFDQNEELFVSKETFSEKERQLMNLNEKIKAVKVQISASFLTNEMAQLFIIFGAQKFLFEVPSEMKQATLVINARVEGGDLIFLKNTEPRVKISQN